MKFNVLDVVENGKLDGVCVHVSYDNGSGVEEYEASIEDLYKCFVKMMRRDGLMPMEGD